MDPPPPLSPPPPGEAPKVPPPYSTGGEAAEPSTMGFGTSNFKPPPEQSGPSIPKPLQESLQQAAHFPVPPEGSGQQVQSPGFVDHRREDRTPYLDASIHYSDVQGQRGSRLSCVQGIVNAARQADRSIDHGPPFLQALFGAVVHYTGMPRLYIVLGLSAVFALYMIIGYFAQFICNLVGFAIPAYASMRAIETTSKDDDTKWLTYWVVFACFSVVDFFADSILRYFPFYWLAKIIFLVYCFFPVQQNGSWVIYNRIIRPYFLKHSGSMDAALQRAANAATAGIDAASSGSRDQNELKAAARSFLGVL